MSRDRVYAKYHPYAGKSAHEIARIAGQWERAYDELATQTQRLLNGLMRGDCWCECGIDNPMMGGRHSNACNAVRDFLRLPKPGSRLRRRRAS